MAAFLLAVAAAAVPENDGLVAEEVIEGGAVSTAR
jgi:hypothetical protein